MNHSEEFNNAVQAWCDTHNASIEFKLVDNNVDPPIVVWIVGINNKYCDFGVLPDDPDYEDKVFYNLQSLFE